MSCRNVSGTSAVGSSSEGEWSEGENSSEGRPADDLVGVVCWFVRPLWRSSDHCPQREDAFRSGITLVEEFSGSCSVQFPFEREGEHREVAGKKHSKGGEGT